MCLNSVLSVYWQLRTIFFWIKSFIFLSKIIYVCLQDTKNYYKNYYNFDALSSIIGI